MRQRTCARFTVALVLGGPLTAQVDVRGYEIAVALSPTGLDVTASIDVDGLAPGPMRLALAAEMQVASVQVAGHATFSRDASATAIGMAKRFLERPYRGRDQDG